MARRMLREGERVTWMHTEGGGGGSGRRVNEKRAVEARLLRIGRGRMQIEIDYGTWKRTTWVDAGNIYSKDPTDTYSLAWRIDEVDARSPEEAARKALTMIRSGQSIAHVFEVTDSNGKCTQVDLDKLDGRV